MTDLADLDAATAAFVSAIRARQLEAARAAASWLPANGNGTDRPLPGLQTGSDALGRVGCPPERVGASEAFKFRAPERQCQAPDAGGGGR